MNSFFKEYFTFTKSERNGVFVLLLILLALIITPRFLFLFSNKSKPDFSKLDKEISSFIKNSKEINDKNKYQPKENINFNQIDESIVKNKINPFYFNPNELPIEKWRELGLTDKQIKTIKNYESKGGKFYKPEDLKKIYGISEAEYNLLAPFIVIPSTNSENKFNVIENKTYIQKDDNIIIDINIADTTEFMKLRGIGASFAKNIIKYREKLGGFIKIEQIKEVWGIDSLKYIAIAKNLIIKQYTIHKININDASVADFKKHPYFDYYVAQSLVSYREKHGKYSKVEDIKKSALVYEALYNKIAPYLTVK